MGPGGDIRVTSHPPTRSITAGVHGLEIDAVSRVDPSLRSRWTTAPVLYPDDIARGSFQLHAALALEWAVDLVVSYQTASAGVDHVELWRVGPSGLRHRRLLTYTPDRRPHGPERGVPVPVTVEVDAWDGAIVGNGHRPARFHLTARDDSHTDRFQVATDVLRFDPVVVHEGARARRYDVFISFKDRDARALAEHLTDVLERHGIDVWYMHDQRRVNYVRDIYDGIANADHFVVVFSDNTLDRPESAWPADPRFTRPTTDSADSPFGDLAELDGDVMALEMVQLQEIRHVLREVETSHGRKSLFIWDVRALSADRPHSPIPDWIKAGQWHVQYRAELAAKALGGRRGRYRLEDLAEVSDEQITIAFGRHVADHVRHARESVGR